MAAHDTLAEPADTSGRPPYAQDSADVVAGLGSDAASGLASRTVRRRRGG